MRGLVQTGRSMSLSVHGGGGGRGADDAWASIARNLMQRRQASEVLLLQLSVLAPAWLQVVWSTKGVTAHIVGDGGGMPVAKSSRQKEKL